MKPLFEKEMLNSTIKSIRVSQDSVLKDVGATRSEKTRADGKFPRQYYAAYFSESLLAKAVCRVMWQNHDEVTNENTWRDDPAPEILMNMKGQVFNARVVRLELQSNYTIEKGERQAISTNKYSFVLFEHEDLEEALELRLKELYAPQVEESEIVDRMN